MRAIWLGLLGFVVGWITMYAAAGDPLHIANPIRLLLASAAGVVCAGVGYTAARNQRAP